MIRARPRPAHTVADYLLTAARIKKRRELDPWTGRNGTARPSQLPPPGDWDTWLILAGRGFGKTRSGAEEVRRMVQYEGRRRIALVAQTAADAVDVMIEGESGLLEVCRRAGFGATFNPSRRRVTFANGAIATYYTAERPRQLRGPQHDGAWCDELASWKYLNETWDMLMFGLRLGHNPRVVVTTTPRPVALIREMVQRSQNGDETIALTTGSTYENKEHLSESFIERRIKPYEGTRLGRQELYAEILEEFEGAFWNLKQLDALRVDFDRHGRPIVPAMAYVGLALDPATTFGDDADETGIAVAGRGVDGNFYVFHLQGIRASPDAIGKTVVALYLEFDCNEIVFEGNNGGEYIAAAIRTAWEKHGQGLPPKLKRLTARGKKARRAEPVAMLYEQGRVHHVGTFAAAEDQMVAFPVDDTAGDDIVDALVHVITAAGKRRLARVA